LFSFTLSQEAIPLTNGESVSGSVKQLQFAYYSVNSTVLGGFNLVVQQNSGVVYVMVGQDYIPNLSTYTYNFFNTNPYKSINVSLILGTFYITVYGYSNANYEITGWGNINLETISPGQVVTGQLDGQDSTYFKFTIPPNAFDFSLIAQTNTGDPDQWVYNTFPFSSYVWANNSNTIGSSCIYVQLPTPGNYYYQIYMSTNVNVTFATGFFVNYGKSCRLPSDSISFDILFEPSLPDSGIKLIKVNDEE